MNDVRVSAYLCVFVSMTCFVQRTKQIKDGVENYVHHFCVGEIVIVYVTRKDRHFKSGCV